MLFRRFGAWNNVNNNKNSQHLTMLGVPLNTQLTLRSKSNVEVLYPAGAEACEKKAKELQAAHGGLYIGMTDCIRSVMCDRDGGLAALGWACHACYTLH